MKRIFLIATLTCILAGCKKEQVCYTGYDHSGNDIGQVCGSNETDCFYKVRGQVWNGAPITTLVEFEATFRRN